MAGPLLSRKLGAKPGAAVTVFFTTSRAELEARFGALKETLAPVDGLWIAWPKKASRHSSVGSFSSATGDDSVGGVDTSA